MLGHLPMTSACSPTKQTVSLVIGPWLAQIMIYGNVHLHQMLFNGLPKAIQVNETKWPLADP